jgi:hypothetical protein
MALVDANSRLLFFMALVSITGICLSQTVDGSQQQRTIRGEVVNSITGMPIPGALVQIGGRHAALTDREGLFEFPNFTDLTEFSGGVVGTGATKPGYFPEQSGFNRFGVSALEGHAITLKLAPEAIISGTVTDQDGQPLQGLHVQLKMLQVRNGLRRWQQMQSTTTNVEGEFRFAELVAGKYSLATGFQIDGLPDAASSVGFAPVTYPPLSGNEEAALTLAWGDHIEANLNPPAQKLYAVTGHVDGPPTQGVNFEAESSNGGVIRPVVRFNRATGDFRLLLPSGSYHLQLHTFVAREQMIGTREILISEAPLRDISMSVAPLATIPVEVEYQNVNPSSQDTQTPQPLFPNVGLEDVDTARSGREFNAQPSQPSSSPGDSLAIRDVEPGQYRLLARPQPPWYLSSASCGGLDLTREPLAIAGSAAGCTIHAVLRNDSAALKWSINENSQTGRTFVYAFPFVDSGQSTAAPNTQPQQASSGIEGSLDGLAPGRYLVIALDHPQELPYREVDVARRYLSLGKEVTLTANGKSEVQLDVVAGEP